NTKYAPTKVSQKCRYPSFSFIIRPNNLGYQWYTPQSMPNMDADPITKWKCATTKYVSCKLMSNAELPTYSPVNPPEMKNDTIPMANNIAGVKRIFPRHSVAR